MAQPPSGLTAEEAAAFRLLLDNGQGHLVADWKGDADRQKKVDFLKQVHRLNSQYPGGLAAYIGNAKKLLRESCEGVNPFDGYEPQVPEGLILKFPSPDFARLEAAGVAQMGRSAVVLVAGGLGERLGYGGIKLELPVETVTGMCYLDWYLQNLSALAAECRSSAPIPLAIMTSGDTHEKTVDLLERNRYFGYPRDAITLMKQEKVPSIDNNEGRFVLAGQYELETKPHGHGDVHQLLHSTGLAKKWAQEGRLWVAFIQDTNAMVFNTLPATIALSAERSLEVNSVCIERKAGEAIGGIARLVSKVKPTMTINVEYNQLDPLLKAATGKGDEPDPRTGASPYPGNINTLVFRIPEYAKNLERTQGLMPEFVNPKYKDASKTEFKKPTRLECMMQDYPKILGPEAKVGFTTFERWFGFSPVKNNVADAIGKAKDGLDPNCASSGEADVYIMQGERLRAAGAQLPPKDAAARQDFLGVPVPMVPRVCLAPSFAPSHAALAKRIRGPVTIAERSSLAISGNVVLENLNLFAGAALRLRAVPGAELTVRKCSVANEGVSFVPLTAQEQKDPSVPEVLRMRGYRTVEKGCKEIAATEPGQWVWDDSRGAGQELYRAGAAESAGGPPPPKQGGGGSSRVGSALAAGAAGLLLCRSVAGQAAPAAAPQGQQGRAKSKL